MIGGIEVDDVKKEALGLEERDKFFGRPAVKLNVVFEVPIFYEAGDESVEAPVGFVDDDLGTPAQGFKADLSRTGKEVEKTQAEKGFAQRREDGFFDPFGGDPGMALFAVVEGNSPALQSARNDAHRCLKSRGQRRTGPFLLILLSVAESNFPVYVLAAHQVGDIDFQGVDAGLGLG